MYRRHISNILGKTTKRHLLAFFVDDYGAIINSNQKHQKQFLLAGGDFGNSRFSKYDTLETNADLGALFDVLSSFKDINGHHVAWTPLAVCANPDFQKIKECGYEDYYYEPLDVTLDYKPECSDVKNLMLQGISEGFYLPQFHGREHINVGILMNALKSGNKSVRLAFDHNSLYSFRGEDGVVSSNQAFRIVTDDDISYYSDIIRDGLKCFEHVYGYKPIHFNAPGDRENSKLASVIAEEGIKYIETDKIKHEYLGSGKWRKEIHWNGEKNQFGQRYIIRNCVFEPGADNADWASYTFRQIQIAFLWHKPAVVSSHRVNFAGAISEENRARGLSQLKKLIGLVKRAYPDVEFVTSKQLFDILYKSK